MSACPSPLKSLATRDAQTEDACAAADPMTVTHVTSIADTVATRVIK
jgi:hypothetical protein